MATKIAKPTIKLIAYENLEPDPVNQRRKMDPAKLAELKQSIDRHGIRNPLEVQRLKKEKYQIVTGHRRYRANGLLLAERKANMKGKRGLHMTEARAAAEAAGWVPCIVLSVEDAKQAKYLQLIENLQREDLTPRDEADGYQWLIDNEGVSPSDIARETGQTTNHIRQRLKMRNCPAKLLDAMEVGRVSAKHCELVGRLPHPADRKQITETILNPEYDDRPLTVDETAKLIERDYMIRLNRRGGCPFDPEDYTLPGGECSACDYLTRNNPDYQDQLADPGRGKRGIDPMICTNPACFRNRAAKAWEREAAAEVERGNRVLSLDESEAEFSGHEGALSYASDLALLDASPNVKDTGHFAGSQLPTWRELLANRGLEVPLIIAQHPMTKKRVELVDRQAAADAINAVDGEKSPFAHAPKDDEGKKVRAKEDRDRKKLREDFAVSVLEIVGEKIKEYGDKGWEVKRDIMKALIAVNLQEQRDSLWFFKQWLGTTWDPGAPSPPPINDDEAFIRWLVEGLADSEEEVFAYLALSILAPSARWLGIEDPHLVVFADRFGIDLEKHLDMREYLARKGGAE